MTDTRILHPSMQGGKAKGYANQLELGVGVLRGARALAAARDDLRAAVTAVDAAEAHDRMELIINETICLIRLYDQGELR